MRKSIFFSLLCLIAIVAVACGGGNNAAGNGPSGGNTASTDGDNGGGNASDPMAFYRTAGNYYMTKSVSKMGDTETVSYTKMEIVKSDDKGYVVKTSSYDKDKKETYSAEAPMQEWPKANGEASGDAPKVETSEETITVEAGEFECIVSETEAGGMKTKTWMSKEHPGLMVKSVSSGEMAGVGKSETVTELVEYKYE